MSLMWLMCLMSLMEMAAAKFGGGQAESFVGFDAAGNGQNNVARLVKTLPVNHQILPG